jgi:hypothetical protein
MEHPHLEPEDLEIEFKPIINSGDKIVSSCTVKIKRRDAR